MSDVQLTAVSKRYGALEVVSAVDLEVKDREFVVIVGPSGCGKSTLLRLIAGLEEITAGDLVIDGRRMNEVPPAERGIAMVFQSYALYPHMSVAENMGFGLKIAGESKGEVRRKVLDAARILQLDQLLERKPKQLSGGQRQRVAIGRAIVRNPKVFLFDEPLSNLDAALRLQMRVELARLRRQLDATMIYVTHDQVEAMTLADKIVVLNGGKVEQVGGPLELYHRPRNQFVASFIGSPKMNFLSGQISDTRAAEAQIRLTDGTSLTQTVRPGAISPGDQVTLGIRPEHLLGGAATVPGARIGAEILVVEHLGGQSFAYARLGDGTPLTVQLPGDSAIRAGDAMEVCLSIANCHLFDSRGERVSV